MRIWLAVQLGFLITVADAFYARSSPASDALIVGQIRTVFVIALENHNFAQPDPTNIPGQILGNAAAPFLNSLITPGNSNSAQVSYAANYYTAGFNVHPSEANYIWSEAGTDFGVHTDADPSPTNHNYFDVPHLTRLLNAAGIPWKNYQEDIEFAGDPTTTVSGGRTNANPYNQSSIFAYSSRHNPMAFFSDTQFENVFALTNLADDLASNSVGRYNWITPDDYNNMHTWLNGFAYDGNSFTSDDAAIAQGDNFLSIVVPQIMASKAYKDNGAIIIWADETEDGDDAGFTMPEIIISPLAKGNAYASSNAMSHSSDLRTMLEIFHLPLTTNAIPANERNVAGGYNNVTSVNDLSDLFVPPLAIESETLATNGFQLQFGATIGQPYRILSGANVAELFSTNATVISSGNAVSFTTTFTDTSAITNANRFYRIVSP